MGAGTPLPVAGLPGIYPQNRMFVRSKRIPKLLYIYISVCSQANLYFQPRLQWQGCLFASNQGVAGSTPKIHWLRQSPGAL